MALIAWISLFLLGDCACLGMETAPMFPRIVLSTLMNF